MSPHLAATLFAAFIALVFAAGFGTALWLDITAQIDRAVRLPEHPRPRTYPPLPVPRAEHPTEHLDLTNVHDLPRKRVDTWL